MKRVSIKYVAWFAVMFCLSGAAIYSLPTGLCPPWWVSPVVIIGIAFPVASLASRITFFEPSPKSPPPLKPPSGVWTFTLIVWCLGIPGSIAVCTDIGWPWWLAVVFAPLPALLLAGFASGIGRIARTMRPPVVEPVVLLDESPADVPSTPSGNEANVPAWHVGDPLAPLSPAMNMTGGSVLAVALFVGMLTGVIWVIFAGWLSEIWRGPWPPHTARVGMIIMGVGSFALFSVAKVAAFLCRAKGRLRVLTIGVSSLLLFAATTGVIGGGGYVLKNAILGAAQNPSADPRFKHLLDPEKSRDLFGKPLKGDQGDLFLDEVKRERAEREQPNSTGNESAKPVETGKAR